MCRHFVQDQLNESYKYIARESLKGNENTGFDKMSDIDILLLNLYFWTYLVSINYDIYLVLIDCWYIY